MEVSRRGLIKLGAVGAAAATLPLGRTAMTKSGGDRMRESAFPKPFSLPFVRPPELTPSGTTDVRCPDGVVRSYPMYHLVQTFAIARIMPGYKTPIFGYNGVTPGPTIRVQRGQPVVVRQTNALHTPPPAPDQNAQMPAPYTNDPLKRWTSTHLHGSASLPQFDGYASDITLPGQYKDYFYPNSQEARTLWYHDHGVHHTSQNAYSGLAAEYILHDSVERNLGIPTGPPYDVPVVIRDAMFWKDGRLAYDDNSESGVYGDVILVNGVPWPEMVVERRKYRFRLLNASASRSYRWQLHDGRSAVPMTVIATDGGLMPKPQSVSNLLHGQAERYEVVIDFAKYPDNTLLTLRNLVPDNNEDFDTVGYAMRFRVRGAASNTSNNTIPADWEERVPVHEAMTFTEQGLRAQGAVQRQFTFERQNGHWVINGEDWQKVIDTDYQHCIAEPESESVEIWTFRNPSGGWFHPVHVHLVDFQVLSRNGRADLVRPHERGPKDVVYLGENETIKVAMRFGGPAAGPGWPRPSGRYMMHCHNLVHEDHDMMVQFSAGDHEHVAELDPVKAARPMQG